MNDDVPREFLLIQADKLEELAQLIETGGEYSSVADAADERLRMVVRIGMVGVCFPNEPYRLDKYDRPPVSEDDCEFQEYSCLRQVGYVLGVGELERLGVVLEAIAEVCGVLACPLHFRHRPALAKCTGGQAAPQYLRDLAVKLRRAVRGEADLPTIDELGMKVLEYLSKVPGSTTQERIMARTYIGSRNTVRRKLEILRGHGLARPPEGKHREIAITPAGVEYLIRKGVIDPPGSC